jgi:hypothetical protein
MKFTSIKMAKFGLFSRHLTKLFDSMAHLTFKDVMGINEVKDIALGMIAKDGEVVDFHSDCLCRGPVSVQFSDIADELFRF